MSAIEPTFVEVLESRRFLAAQPACTATYFTLDSTLVVRGSPIQENDIIVRVETGALSGQNVDVFVVFDNGMQIAIGDPAAGQSGLGVQTSTVSLIEVYGGRRANNIQVDDAGATDSSGNPVSAYIMGGPGADTLTGGSGDDTIEGGAGNDVITDGNGNDRIDGGPGNDIINVGGGSDTVSGGTGNDTIIVQPLATTPSGATGPSADVLDGGAGDDIIIANIGDDMLLGGPGNDTLIAGSGNDTLLGGAGRDRLVGNSTGSAEMFGGPGIDLFLDVYPQDVVEDHQPHDVPIVYGT